MIDLEKDEVQLRLKRMKVLKDSGYFPQSYDLPVSFQLELTTQCNLKCKHCYNCSGYMFQEELKQYEWESVCSEINQISPFNVIISGGEPLIYGEQLFHLMDIIGKDTTRFVLVTNGWFADRSVILKLNNYKFNWIQISIDGFSPNVHDNFRGVNGSWKRAIKAAADFADQLQPVVIAHTIHPENFETLGDMIDLSFTLGACRIICDEAMIVGRAYSNRNNLRLSVEQKKYIQEVLIAKRLEYESSMEVIRASDIATSFVAFTMSPNSGLLIRPNGDVKLECVLPFIIGNIRKNSLKTMWKEVGFEAWKHPDIQKFVNSYKISDSFDTCEKRPYVNDDILLTSF